MVSDKAVRVALYNKLNVAGVTANLASGSASIHHSVAPSGSAYPMIVFQKQSGIPVRSFGSGSNAHFDDQVWLVKTIAKGGSSSAAEDTMEDVADALDLQTLTISGATNMYLAREGSVDYVEEADGETYRHHGSLYRLIYEEA